MFNEAQEHKKGKKRKTFVFKNIDRSYYVFLLSADNIYCGFFL